MFYFRLLLINEKVIGDDYVDRKNLDLLSFSGVRRDVGKFFVWKIAFGAVILSKGDTCIGENSFFFVRKEQ